ncbi:hypothetical protein Tco_0508090 [Tanacetum coccineum]
MLKKPLRKLLYNQGNLHENVKCLHNEMDEVQKALDLDPSNSILSEEAWDIVAHDKPPGPDRYTVAFFKEAWDIVAHDVVRAIQDKIISNRIKEGLTDLVSLNQSTFVPGRRISDNILLTQELVHNYHHDRGPPRCAFKVDIQKAYDTVDKGFLKGGACWFWVSFPYDCLDYGRRVRDSESITYHHHCSKLNIINLCFAGDLFLFADGDVNSAKVIMDGLDEFKNASGLVPKGLLPVKYLGVPLILTRLVYRDCKELVEKVQNRIRDWKNKFLTFADRLQLVQSMLSSKHVYWASVSILPSWIMLDIEQLMRAFLWSQTNTCKGKAKVAFEVVCLPKHEGVLGIKDLMLV